MITLPFPSLIRRGIAKPVFSSWQPRATTPCSEFLSSREKLNSRYSLDILREQQLSLASYRPFPSSPRAVLFLEDGASTSSPSIMVRIVYLPPWFSPWCLFSSWLQVGLQPWWNRVGCFQWGFQLFSPWTRVGPQHNWPRIKRPRVKSLLRDPWAEPPLCPRKDLQPSLVNNLFSTTSELEYTISPVLQTTPNDIPTNEAFFEDCKGRHPPSAWAFTGAGRG